jgi:predicted acetyltransferase
MLDLDVSIALAHERAALENLMQLYIHDFSELWVGDANVQGDLRGDGRFPDYPLDPYWREPEHVPLLFRVSGHLVGFALLNRASHTNRVLDRNMAEFFVARKHRRSGVGTWAAHTIFSRYPGLWETAVARRNAAALPFWRRVVAKHPLAQDIVEEDVASSAWNGPVICFRIRPAA